MPMPLQDRDDFLRLLDRLGDPDDASALAAARELHARALSAGGWPAILPPAPPAARESAPIPSGSDAELIEALLARSISDTTREELEDIRRELAEGRLSDMDRNYLRGLAARLTS